MFYCTLNNYILSLIENGKLKYLFSGRKKPDIVLTDKNDIAVVIKYNAKRMPLPIVLEKSKNSYAQKIIRFCSEESIAVIENKELANNLFSDAKTGQIIPFKYLDKVAKIYHDCIKTKTLDFDVIFNAYNGDNNKIPFEEILEIQRDRKQEILSIIPPDKIQLDLSCDIHEIIEPRRFIINVNGFIVHNIKVIYVRDLKFEEFNIRINGLVVKHGNIKYTYISPFDQLTLYLSETLKKFSIDLIGYDETAFIISQVKQRHPILVEEIMKYYKIGEIRKVLRGLLCESIAIQDIVTIFETMADFGEECRYDIESIIDVVKKAVGRSICLSYLSDDDLLKVIYFENEFEKHISENTIDTRNGKIINEKYFKIISNILPVTFNELRGKNIKPILLCSLPNKPLIKKAVEQFDKDVLVFSISEIPEDIRIEFVHKIREN